MQAVVRITAGEGLHVFEIVFLRNLLAALFMAPFFLRLGRSPEGGGALRTKCLGLHVARGFFQVTAMLMYWMALTLVPLADATVLLFTSPIFATMGAILFLGEGARAKRWASIGLGFIGMLIIVRPHVAPLELGVALGLGGSVLFAGSRLIAKRATRVDSAPTVVAYLAFTTTPLSLVPALFVWTWPSLEMVALLVVIAALGTLTHLLMTQAFREGDLTAVEPLYFTRLIWASLIGYVLFAEIPVIWTWTGAAVIIASTTLLVRSETRPARS
jgi:drug/metabolite transporter (DMT)-like permease